jgi:hypothetical protein
MAELARRNCDLLDVTVETIPFEDWEPAARDFRLVMSAQAWPWVRPGLRLAKAHDVLAYDGALALFWNRPDWSDTSLRRAIDAVYEDVAPVLRARTPGRSQQDAGRRACIDEPATSPRFSGVALTQHSWATSYDTTAYLDLLSTQSDHRLLDAERRARLFDGIADAVEGAGGEMPVSYVADLYVARRVG